MNSSKSISNIFPSAGGNIYYYSKDEKSFFTVHPLFYLFDRNNKFLKTINNKDFLEIKKELNQKNIKFSLTKVKKIHKQYLFIKKRLPQSNNISNYRFTKLSDKSIVINNFNQSQQIIFEVTDKCNLNCTYCSYGSLYKNYDERYKKDMDFNTIKTVIDYYTPFWKKRAKGEFREKINISFYGGEPLLRIDLIKKAIDYLEKLGLPNSFFTFSLTTNGILLKKNIDFLVNYDFTILISLDGNEYNHSFRIDHQGNNSFDKVIDNVRFIKNKYPIYFNDKVNFNTVLHSRNNLTDINDFFNKERLPQPSISELSLANAWIFRSILTHQ